MMWEWEEEEEQQQQEELHDDTFPQNDPNSNINFDFFSSLSTPKVPQTKPSHTPPPFSFLLFFL